MTTLCDIAHGAFAHNIWGQPSMIKFEVRDKNDKVVVLRGLTQSYFGKLYAEVAMIEAQRLHPENGPYSVKEVKE